MKDTTSPGYPATVTTTLSFYDGRQSENNYRWTGSNESERPMNFAPPDRHDVVVQDLRGLSTAQREEKGITVDKAGFEIVQGWWGGPEGEKIKADWEQKKWDDESWIKGTYYDYVKRHGSERFLRLSPLILFLYKDDQREMEHADSGSL